MMRDRMQYPVPFRVLRALVEFMELRRSDIMLDIENFGTLKPALQWAEDAGLLE